MLRHTTGMICWGETFLDKATWEIWPALLSENTFPLTAILPMSSETPFLPDNLFSLFPSHKSFLWAWIRTIHLLLSTVNQTEEWSLETVGAPLKNDQSFPSVKKDSLSWVQTKQKNLFPMSWLPKPTTHGTQPQLSQSTRQAFTQPSVSRSKTTPEAFLLWANGTRDCSPKTVMNTRQPELSFRRKTLMILQLMLMQDFWQEETLMSRWIWWLANTKCLWPDIGSRESTILTWLSSDRREFCSRECTTTRSRTRLRKLWQSWTSKQESAQLWATATSLSSTTGRATWFWLQQTTPLTGTTFSSRTFQRWHGTNFYCWTPRTTNKRMRTWREVRLMISRIAQMRIENGRFRLVPWDSSRGWYRRVRTSVRITSERGGSGEGLIVE